MTKLGFRILPMPRRPAQQLIEQYRTVVTPHISDNMSRIHAGGADLRPYHRGGKLVGTALTVKSCPGDNLMVHKAIDIAEPGDVIVVDAGGDLTHAIIGEIMLRLAKKKGVAGFIINGAIRDLSAFAADDFPVYAKGVTHRGPYKEGPGEINVPIALDGMVINPGDIIVGDEDGVVSVPLDVAESILVAARKHEELENAIMQSIENGTVDRSWVDETLKLKGCDLSVGRDL